MRLRDHVSMLALPRPAATSRARGDRLAIAFARERRTFAVATSISLAALLCARPAHAICGELDLDAFTLASRAASIALVQTDPQFRATVERTIRGDARIFSHLARRPRAIVRRGRGGRIVLPMLEDCDQSYLELPPSSAVVAFVDANGRASNRAGPSYVSFANPPGSSAAPPDAVAAADSIRAFLDAPDASERARVLLHQVSTNGVLASDAVRYLANAPDALHALSHADRVLVATAVRAFRRYDLRPAIRTWLEWTLARMHEPAAIDTLRWLEALPLDGVEIGSAGVDPRELFANRSGPAHDTSDEWSAWWNAIPRVDRASLLASGWTSRHASPVDEQDLRALAAAIRTGATLLDRSIAVDLCEQRIARRIAAPASPREDASLDRMGSALYDLMFLLPHDSRWNVVAAACERGPVAP